MSTHLPDGDDEISFSNPSPLSSGEFNILATAAVFLFVVLFGLYFLLGA